MDSEVTASVLNKEIYKTNAESTRIKELSLFTPNRILSEDLRKKTICIKGNINAETPALIVLEQTPFGDDEESLKALFSVDSKLKTEAINDVYGKYECIPVQKLRGIKTTIIHPATEEDIKKYEIHPMRIGLETPEYYNDVTLPRILNQLNLQWISDILDKKSDKKILFEDNSAVIGFTVVPHLSWIDDDVDELHVVAIVHQKGIKSIRDLNDQHLPLLKNIEACTTKFIEETYGVYSSRVVAFLHYHPSYYHLHIHFANVSCQDLDNATENSHLLTEVINNIELIPNYYQKAELSYTYNLEI